MRRTPSDATEGQALSSRFVYQLSRLFFKTGSLRRPRVRNELARFRVLPPRAWCRVVLPVRGGSEADILQLR
jgi:hypothetical protein